MSWLSVWAGIAGGALGAAVIFAVGFLATSSFTDELAGGLVLVTSLLVGLAGGGWIAGRMAPINGRFHGSLTGLGLALVVVVIARLGGSPAPTSQVLILAVLAIALGGVGGWRGGHRG
ncbi:MAG: hypothetical protein Q8Q52_06030 [Acidimicrobiia bacterium]|nr:hypothetical protein [Acidimicrobiia bacterium]